MAREGGEQTNQKGKKKAKACCFAIYARNAVSIFMLERFLSNVRLSECV